MIIDIFELLKYAMLTFILIFVVFTIVIVNQINTMNKIFLEIQSSELLKVIAIAFVTLAVSLFAIAIVIL
ncbi:MAG: hypothetical protein Q8P26_03600 [Candidatus Levybacteria bacterium]|nr:hypothetical protein [Candidatus Levybacteria bacterium]